MKPKRKNEIIILINGTHSKRKLCREFDRKQDKKATILQSSLTIKLLGKLFNTQLSLEH
jgi:hypothetical protein